MFVDDSKKIGELKAELTTGDLWLPVMGVAGLKSVRVLEAMNESQTVLRSEFDSLHAAGQCHEEATKHLVQSAYIRRSRLYRTNVASYKKRLNALLAKA